MRRLAPKHQICLALSSSCPLLPMSICPQEHVIDLRRRIDTLKLLLGSAASWGAPAPSFPKTMTDQLKLKINEAEYNYRHLK